MKTKEQLQAAQEKYKVGDNVIVTCHDGEHNAIITKVYPNYIRSGETRYQVYGEDFCVTTDSRDMRLAPTVTMVLTKT